MLSNILVSSLALAQAASAAAVSLQPRQAPSAWTDFTDNAVFKPGQSWPSWRTLYARTLQLPDQSILLSWEDYDDSVAADQAYFPIYKSTDGGASFSSVTRVYDQVNGWGNRYQPFLFTLTQDMGGFAAGTILLAGTSTPSDLSQAYIDLYASKDQGNNWEFVSHIAYGPGPETTTNGDKAVWEPFLLIHDNQLVCYYSTQVDPNHAQKLVHVTTNDLKNWSSEVEDVAQPKYTDRPGMTTVAYSPVSGKYVMTFEYCQDGVGCPVHFKVANSPLEFGPEEPAPLVSDNNPSGSPYVIWTDAGDGTGVFIANGNGREEVFVNTDAVDPNGWKAVNVGQWSAYSRSLRIIDTPADSAAKGAKKLLIANGGNIGCSGSCYNYVADGVVDIPSYPA